jgi:adenosine kinase
LNDFTPQEMEALIDASRWLVVNGFEWQMLTERLGLSAVELHARLEWTVVTQGADGSVWQAADGETVTVPAVAPVHALDPTGCGDAFRAGLVHGLARQAPMIEALRCAATTATLNLESHGTQTHRFDSLIERYAKAWGAPPDWLVSAARQHQGAQPA